MSGGETSEAPDGDERKGNRKELFLYIERRKQRRHDHATSDHKEGKAFGERGGGNYFLQGRSVRQSGPKESYLLGKKKLEKSKNHSTCEEGGVS